MKKLLIITNLFWVSVIVLPSFVQPENTNPANTSSYHLIDASLAKMMAENYRNFYVNTFIKKLPTVLDKANGTRNLEDSRTIWFSTKKIREFMDDAETTSLGNSLGQDSLSGLRFYYIKYPEYKAGDANNPWIKYAYFSKNGLPTDYQNKHSLMIVPTYFDSATQTHVDFDPRKYDSNNKPLSMGQVFQALIAKENNSVESLGANPTGSSGGVALRKAFITMPDNSNVTNAGGLIPPYTNGNNTNLMRVTSSSGRSLIKDVPCSGAKLMLFVDGYMNCGPQPLPSGTTTTTPVPVPIQRHN